jgi:hypothetical protein
MLQLVVRRILARSLILLSLACSVAQRPSSAAEPVFSTALSDDLLHIAVLALAAGVAAVAVRMVRRSQ